MTCLAFGSGDSSVILETSLTSLASVTSPSVNTISAVGSVLTYTAGTFDPGKGYKTPTTINAQTRAGGIEYDLTTSYPESLDEAGQFSFETEWQYVTQVLILAANLNEPYKYGTPTPHGGHNHETDAHAVRKEMVSLHPTNAGGISFAFVTDEHRFYLPTGKSTGNFLCCFGKSVTSAEGEFCRVTVSWHGQRREIYINGARVWYANDCTGANTYPALRYLHIGSGSAGYAPVVSGQHFRNFTLSTKPVSRAAHPLLANIVCVGDSFFDNITDYGQIPATATLTHDPWQSSAPFAMDWVFSKHGLRANINTATGSNSGAVIYARGSNEINDLLANALALRPRIVCYRGGTNDALQHSLGHVPDLSVVNTQLLLDAQTILDTPGVEYLVIGTVPTLENDYTHGTAASITAVNTINGYINGLQAALTAIDAAYAGRVKVYDMFTDFGGHDSENSLGYFADTASGGDLHPGSYGSWVMGVGYAEKIIECLG